jgi:type II secretory pathway pseudopilin PulG
MILDKKGISMISLVVVIVVTLILIALAIKVGFSFIEESRKTEETLLTNVVSEAVERRQNDRNVETELIYEGYKLDATELSKLVLDGITVDITTGEWYILDAKKAKNLGVESADKYIVEDATAIDESTSEKQYVALVEYTTGKVYIVQIGSNISSETANHRWSVATCTEASVCLDCGAVSPAGPLGHNFVPPHATCTQDSVCTRCGFVGEKALGHAYNVDVLAYDDQNHWEQCERCGAIRNTEPHEKIPLESDPTGQSQICANPRCNWHAEVTPIPGEGVPDFTEITIISNNTVDTSFAKTGDIVTLTMTANKTLKTRPIVTIGGKTAVVTGSDVNWVATVTVSGDMPETILPISIRAYKSTTGEEGPERTSTTDGSTVTYDKTPPIIEYINK